MQFAAANVYAGLHTDINADVHGLGAGRASSHASTWGKECCHGSGNNNETVYYHSRSNRACRGNIHYGCPIDNHCRSDPSHIQFHSGQIAGAPQYS